MKKTLVSALTTALVVGAASTTFAAANPFSDVPADHWAYDAVAQLAKDGVVDGYGDSTFKGDNAITRYEMAQIVAKAMAKEDQANAADKAMIDKLAAEFSAELNNLGVRVSNLEKKTDNVKFGGVVEYTYTSTRHDGQAKSNSNELLFRLEPDATVNNNWHAKARIDYDGQMNDSKNVTNAKVDRAWMQGTYGNTVINVGKIPYTTVVDRGMAFDSVLSGGQVTVGKQFKTTLTAGRFNTSDAGIWNANNSGDVANFQGLEFAYNATKKLDLGAGYYHITGANDTTYGKDNVKSWDVAATYRFTPTLAVNAAYGENTEAEKGYKKAASLEVDYKGANPANKGSFGIYAAYRHLGKYAMAKNTYGDGAGIGQKGWEIGSVYTLAPNIQGIVKYFNGKDLQGDTSASKLFGRFDFFF